MKLLSMVGLLVYFSISGCATDSGHQVCIRSERVKHQDSYCCGNTDYSGYCGSYCYNSYYLDECKEWACEEGYVMENVKKEGLEWWQIVDKLAGGTKCVPVGK